MKKGVAMIRGVCTYCTEQIDLKLHILPANWPEKLDWHENNALTKFWKGCCVHCNMILERAWMNDTKRDNTNTLQQLLCLHQILVSTPTSPPNFHCWRRRCLFRFVRNGLSGRKRSGFPENRRFPRFFRDFGRFSAFFWSELERIGGIPGIPGRNKHLRWLGVTSYVCSAKDRSVHTA